MPAMNQDPQTLIAAANCYRCYGVNGMGQLMRLGLLLQLATTLNPMADTSAQTLIENGRCFNCFGSTDMGGLIELGLLKIIGDNIGSGGGSAPDSIDYAGPPLLNPPALQNIVVDVNGQQWQFFNNQWN